MRLSMRSRAAASAMSTCRRRLSGSGALCRPRPERAAEGARPPPGAIASQDGRKSDSLARLRLPLDADRAACESPERNWPGVLDVARVGPLTTKGLRQKFPVGGDRRPCPEGT